MRGQEYNQPLEITTVQPTLFAVNPYILCRKHISMNESTFLNEGNIIIYYCWIPFNCQKFTVNRKQYDFMQQQHNWQRRGDFRDENHSKFHIEMRNFEFLWIDWIFVIHFVFYSFTWDLQLDRLLSTVRAIDFWIAFWMQLSQWNSLKNIEIECIVDCFTGRIRWPGQARQYLIYSHWTVVRSSLSHSLFMQPLFNNQSNR